MANLNGKTIFITGASRGIGKAIALRAARDGANVAVIGKTAEPAPATPHMRSAQSVRRPPRIRAAGRLQRLIETEGLRLAQNSSLGRGCSRLEPSASSRGAPTTS